MALKLVCSMQTLMMYAAEVGKARKSGDPERIKQAEKKHDDYVQWCLEADELHMGMTVGELWGKNERN